MLSSPDADAPSGAGPVMTMPKLGLTMTEGLLSELRVAPGDRVKAGDVVFIVETDKIANEIEAPADGVVGALLAEAGQTLAVGAPVLSWAGEVSPKVLTATASPTDAGRIMATPLARRIARERGVDLATLQGSGPRGRIKLADVESAAPRPPLGPPAPPVAAAEPVLPPTQRHLAMVRRVVAAKRDIPHFYLTRRAELSALAALRMQLNEAGGPKFTLNHFILKSVGQALLVHPDANRLWGDDGFIACGGPDVGFVVDTGAGLFIPVLKDAGCLPMDALAREARRLAARARDGQLTRTELDGGSISVSNLGMAGVESVTPIISPPQAAILGVGALSEVFRPDAEGRPALRREIVLTLACDHRVHDGMAGARLLDAIVYGLETPHALLLTRQVTEC